MSEAEFGRWRAFDRAEPLPNFNWLFAQLCQVIANCNRAGGAAYDTEDFYPPRRKPKPRAQTGAEARAAIRGL